MLFHANETLPKSYFSLESFSYSVLTSLRKGLPHFRLGPQSLESSNPPSFSVFHNSHPWSCGCDCGCGCGCALKPVSSHKLGAGTGQAIFLS